MARKLIVEEYTDPDTGMKILIDDRGNYHCFMQQPQEIKVTVENGQVNESELLRYKRILEALRRENNWLWDVINTAIKKKKTPQRALEEVEKRIKERTRA